MPRIQKSSTFTSNEHACKNKKNRRIENRKCKSQLFRFIPLVRKIDTDTQRDLRHPSTQFFRLSSTLVVKFNRTPKAMGSSLDVGAQHTNPTFTP